MRKNSYAGFNVGDEVTVLAEPKKWSSLLKDRSPIFSGAIYPMTFVIKEIDDMGLYVAMSGGGYGWDLSYLVDNSLILQHGINLRGTLKTKEKTMSLIEKIKLATKGEPEKSCIKAGILKSDESFTADGQEVFLSWLFKKHGPEFKKEVVDPILEDESKK